MNNKQKQSITSLNTSHRLVTCHLLLNEKRLFHKEPLLINAIQAESKKTAREQGILEYKINSTVTQSFLIPNTQKSISTEHTSQNRKTFHKLLHKPTAVHIINNI